MHSSFFNGFFFILVLPSPPIATMRIKYNYKTYPLFFFISLGVRSVFLSAYPTSTILDVHFCITKIDPVYLYLLYLLYCLCHLFNYLKNETVQLVTLEMVYFMMFSLDFPSNIFFLLVSSANTAGLPINVLLLEIRADDIFSPMFYQYSDVHMYYSLSKYFIYSDSYH